MYPKLFKIYKPILLLLILLTLISCNKDNDQEIQPLVISSYSPEIDYIGDDVVLTGQNINTSIEYLVKLNDSMLNY